MTVYLVRASEWETNISCVCATKELAEKERKRLARKYGLYHDEIEDCIECIEMDVIDVANGGMTGLEFRNELVRRLNNNAMRYAGASYDGREYLDVELFDVDEVYEIIDRVLARIPEDTNE